MQILNFLMSTYDKYKGTIMIQKERALEDWKEKLVLPNLTIRGPCIVINSYNKSQRDAPFLKFIFDKELYMFRTDLLTIIRSLNTVYKAIGICHASYVDCLLARSGWKHFRNI